MKTKSKPRRVPKPVKAWAIVEGNRLAIFDHRLPVYWRKRIAKQSGRYKCFEHQIVPVTITITPTQRPGKRGGK